MKLFIVTLTHTILEGPTLGDTQVEVSTLPFTSEEAAEQYIKDEFFDLAAGFDMIDDEDKLNPELAGCCFEEGYYEYEENKFIEFWDQDGCGDRYEYEIHRTEVF